MKGNILKGQTLFALQCLTSNPETHVQEQYPISFRRLTTSASIVSAGSPVAAVYDSECANVDWDYFSCSHFCRFDYLPRSAQFL